MQTSTQRLRTFRNLWCVRTDKGEEARGWVNADILCFSQIFNDNVPLWALYTFIVLFPLQSLPSHLPWNLLIYNSIQLTPRTRYDVFLINYRYFFRLTVKLTVLIELYINLQNTSTAKCFYLLESFLFLEVQSRYNSNLP